MNDIVSEFPEQLPDLSLWEGLQDALCVSDVGKKQERSGDTKKGEAGSSRAIIEFASSQEEKKQGKFRCESCGKAWARYGFFIRHVKKEHDMQEFIAKVQKRGGGKGGIKVECKFCHGQVAKVQLLDHFWRRHVDHSQPAQGARPCLFCKKTLASLDKLRCHLQVIHFKELYVEPTRFGLDVNKALL